MLLIMSVPGLVNMAVPSGRLMPSGRIMSQIMFVLSLVCMAGAWSEEPLGGLKSWPTSHDATPPSPNICGRHGIVSCAFTAARGAMPLPALGLKNPKAA